ncbi:MAG: hypothetical protein EA391_01170 [Balneolaceae bacterium]|nr:MAG: hypothetical protein EA391_01170 [Balneolaceae bacterium]
MNYLNKIIFTAIISVILILPEILFSQNIELAEMDVLAREDGTAYIFHDYAIPLSHGFHVYRNVNDGKWEQLTDKPIFPVQNGFQLQQQMGDEFEFIQESMEIEDAQRTFLLLRAQTDENAIINATLPNLARLLGRSFIDQNAPIGEIVAYRIEIVDDLNRPTGDILEHESRLTPERPLQPQNVEADHEERRVRLQWSFPTYDEDPATENVMRFQTFYRDMSNNRTVDATDAILLRTTNQNEYRKHITVPHIDREYEFWVVAMDYSGQQSERSEVVTLLIRDNIPPSMVRRVRANVNERYHSEITWPASTDIDVVGYHVYKARGDEEEYHRITEELLPPLQTFFVHEETEPGVQFRYAVTAVDENGNESERSNPAHVYIWDYRTPEPVSDLSVSFDVEQFQTELSWQSHNDPEMLRTFQILRRQIHPEAGVTFDQLNESAHLEPHFTDSGYQDGFREGLTFEYGVVTVALNGNRSDTVWTDIQIPVITPPEPPVSIDVRMRNTDRVQVTWPASVSTDVTSYKVYRHHVESDSTNTLTERDRGMRIYRDDEIELFNHYVYSVTAVDSAGNESEPVLADTLLAHHQQPPPRSRNVQAFSVDEGVELRWQVQDSNVVDRFKIYRANIATGIFETIAEVDGAETTFIHTESEAGQWFKVYPVDRLGREARTATPVQAVNR